MNICVLVCVYGRHDILRIFAMGIERIASDYEPFTGFTVIAAASNEEDYELCQELGFQVIMAPNQPLGQKHNILLEHILKKKAFSHIFLSGSDNLYPSSAITALLDTHHFHVGFRKMYAKDVNTGEVFLHEYAPGTRIVGAGRLMSCQALESAFKTTRFYPRNGSKKDNGYLMSVRNADYLRYRHAGKNDGLFKGIWDAGISRALDNSFDLHMAQVGYAPMCLESERVNIIDLKGSFSINSTAHLKLQEGSVTTFDGEWDWFLSDKEKSAIKALQKV